MVAFTVVCIVGSSDDLSLLPALAEAGVDCFQVRDKTLDDPGLLALTKQVIAAVRPATVIVNDRVQVAVAAGAAGVHLGKEDLPVAEARALAPDLVIGATCRDAADVDRALEDGADYVGFGPVFATTSKTGLPEPRGLDGLAGALGAEGTRYGAGAPTRSTNLPVLAIGGIDEHNVADVVAAGAYGVAVIGGIWRAPDPVGAAARIVAAVGR